MAEYIERETAMLLPELPKEYRHYQTDNLDDAYEQGWYDALCCLEHIPAADVAPVVHGRWIWHERYFEYECSACKCRFDFNNTYGIFDHTFENGDYCPNCGAKMRFDNEQK